ncbi:MAG TPA: aldehyde dehydrogenase family protein [Solirubrobacteraceae bacterium]
MSTTTADPVTEHVRGHDFRMLIGGDLVGAADGATMQSIDPSTGELLTTVPSAGAADVQRAYEAAAAAQPAWEALGVDGRAEVFAGYSAAIEANAERLAMLDAIDGGMPYRAMLVDIQISLANLRDWPGLVRWHGGRTIPASPGNLHYTSYRAYGVVGKILAYNHPAMFAITRILGALIAGNAIVIKPAPQVPLSALVLGELAREVFPPGVFNVLTGGADAGDAIVTHPGIRRIGFTGSVPTGLKIQQRAATVGVKHVSLELGGKNPMVVFPDTDLDRAIEGAVNGMNFGICAGQSCGSNSRTYIHRDIYEDFLGGVAERLEAMRVAPAYGEDADMGPVVSAEHHARVMGFVESGRAQGARLITGGDRPNGTTPEGGYYVRPTLFADVSTDMDIGRKEIFGPVMSMAPWDDIDEVVAKANDTDLGLTAAVWTNDLHVAHRVADRLEAGYVWINDTARHYWGTPFGGVKNSGIGREESIEEYESYLEQKTVHTILREPRL